MARGDEEVKEPKRVIPPGAVEVEKARVDVGDDDLATKEAALLSRGRKERDLKGEAEEKEHDRAQHFKDHFEFLSIIMLDVLFAGFILLAAAWVAHLILPDHKVDGWAPFIHGWLSKDQLDHISGVLTTGVIAGLVADHFKRRMG